MIKCHGETLTGLEVLHSQNVVHEDFKPSNLLVCNKPETGLPDFENPQIKIIDFGMAVYIKKPVNTSLKHVFSMIYVSPEQALNQEDLVNASSDIFCTGITFYEIFTFIFTYSTKHPAKLLNLMIAAPLKPQGKIPSVVFDVLSKATNKFQFPLPPKHYPLEKIRQGLIAGQLGRYKSAGEFRTVVSHL